jgi:very-short-patch-repair endonuclease
MLGLKFRRQGPIDDFIVDFYCDELRLVIEIDGDVHETPAQLTRDKARDKRLFELGYQILRIPNNLAIRDPESLIQMLRALRPSPGAPKARRPLPGGEGL